MILCPLSRGISAAVGSQIRLKTLVGYLGGLIERDPGISDNVILLVPVIDVKVGSLREGGDMDPGILSLRCWYCRLTIIIGIGLCTVGDTIQVAIRSDPIPIISSLNLKITIMIIERS